VQKASVGGVLGIVAGILGIFWGLFMLAMPALMKSSTEFGSGYSSSALDLASAVYITLGVIILIISGLGVVGSIFATRRQLFGLALAGAIASSIAFYPLGIVAVVLVSMGYPEFSRSVPVAAPAEPASLAPPSLPL